MEWAAAALLFCGAAAAQDVSSTTAVSTSAAVAVSTQTAPAPEKPRAVHRILARLHPQAKHWRPVSLVVGGDAEAARDFWERQLTRRRIKGRLAWRGRSCPATAKARSYRLSGGDRRLIVSLFPKTSKLRGYHLEFRFLISEGYLDSMQVASVRSQDASLDSVELTRKGIDFREDFPGSGRLVLSALDFRPGRRALNAGALERASFADPELGLLSAGFSARGVRSGPGEP